MPWPARKQRSWLSGLLGDLEAVAGGDRAHLGLVQLGEREAHAVEQPRRQRGEHVALVLGLVGRGREQRAGAVVDDARVVAGDELVGAEPLGEVDHRRDPHLAVADDAGVGRGAGRVAVEEAADDAAPELLLEVEGQVRHADRVGDGAGAEHGLRRAAGLGAVGVGIGPELEGDADHLGPALALEQGGDGAVDAARHGDEDATRRRVGEALGGGGGAGQGAVQGVGRELGRVSLGRGQAADLGVDLLDAEARGEEDGLPVDHLGRGGRGGAHRPAALGVEAGGGDPPVLDPQRDPREVAAGGAPGGAA